MSNLLLEIKNLEEMRAKGIIDDQEFKKIKKQLIGAWEVYVLKPQLKFICEPIDVY